MKKTGRIIGLGGVVIAMTLASGATAVAKTAAPTSPTAGSVVPSGYKIVHHTFTAAAGTQTFGSVNCPVTSTGVQRKPQSGGVFISSSDLGANINESQPNGNSWQAYVNNNGSTSTSFTVYAVCAKPRTGYTVVAATFTNFANSEVVGDSVQCPTGTRVLGGGSSNPSLSLLVNMNTSFPSGNGWRVDQNNGDSSDTTMTIYAVCSKYGATQHYGIHVGTPWTIPPAPSATPRSIALRASRRSAGASSRTSGPSRSTSTPPIRSRAGGRTGRTTRRLLTTRSPRT